MNGGNGALSYSRSYPRSYPVVRRILVAVDAAPDSIAVLETAGELAAGLNAELRGIFVEDINLLRLAGLPFAREVVWSSATELHLDYQRMERVLRSRGSHARQAVVSITTQLKLHGSLQIVRGQVVRELVQAAAEADLVILGKGGVGGRIGRIALRVANEAPCSVLLLSPLGIPRRQAVMTTYTGQATEEDSLRMAASLARLVHGRLLVVIPAATHAEAAPLQNQAHSVLGEGSLSVTYLALKTPDTRSYQRLAREERVGLAVIADAMEDAADLESRLAALGCSVLVLR